MEVIISKLKDQIEINLKTSIFLIQIILRSSAIESIHF